MTHIEVLVAIFTEHTQKFSEEYLTEIAKSKSN